MKHGLHMFRVLSLAVMLTVGLSACSSVPRHAPVPASFKGMAAVEGYPANIRSWGDEPSPNLDTVIAQRISLYKESNADYYAEKKAYPAMNYLAISGGGSNGSFGAGLIYGWTEKGTRPNFTIVTGVSTGALIAPFAFLGEKYDPVLREVYTTLSPENIYSGDVWTVLDGVTGGLALADSAPLSKVIERTITPKLFSEIAAEHRKGRRLYIGTSNLEAQRSVIWDIGAIANSGNPNALNLFRKIMLASAAVPGVFKPVFIDVIVGGKKYQEIHVDGGVTAQVFLYPLKTYRADHDAYAKDKIERRLYIVRNNKILPEFKPMEPGLFSVSRRSLETLTKYQGIGDLYRLYIGAQRDGIDYKLVHIPADFRDEPKVNFDPVYMGALFDLGRSIGKADDTWEDAPPGVKYIDQTHDH